MVLLIIFFALLAVPQAYADNDTSASGTSRPRLIRERDFQPTVAARREEIIQHREEIKAQFQVRLEEQKTKIVERIQESLNRKNERWMMHFQNVLARLSDILGRISTRVDTLKEQGEDVSAVEAAIATASTAIADATTAVSVQAEKIYQITVTDESTVREDVSQVAAQLREDLRTVRELVQSARETVRAALRELFAVYSLTSTPTPTP